MKTIYLSLTTALIWCIERCRVFIRPPFVLMHRGHSTASVCWTWSTTSCVRTVESWLGCELQEQTRFISAACCPGDQEWNSSVH